MTDYYLPPTAQAMEWELRSVVPRFQSPMGGVTRTLDRFGARWAATFRWDVLVDQQAAQIKAFLGLMRGGANRFWCYDPSYTQRGSFSAPELFTNSDFSNGTTGWTAANAALSALDREMRITASTVSSAPQFYQAATLTQYAPHALRSHIVDGLQSSGVSIGPALSSGNNAASSYSTSRGLVTISAVTDSSASENHSPVIFNASSGFMAGAYATCPYTSLARCALVDNGPNMLLRSDQQGVAPWSLTKVTVPSTATAPDGTATGAVLQEDNTSGQHEVHQAVTVSSAAGDYAISVAARSGGRDFIRLAVTEGTGSSSVSQFFNLSTGAVGSTGATGANWSNRRAFIVPLGNAWYLCTLVGRKTNAATSLTVALIIGSADGTDNYLGNGASSISLWRATLAQSSVPTRLVTTAGSAVAATAQTGSGIYLKGLPASTDGLLYGGDYAEFITPTYSELKRATKPLSSDAAGRAFIQFEPTLRQSPADNAAVIIRKPMVRMLLDDSTVKMQHMPAGIMSCTFTAVEDVTA